MPALMHHSADVGHDILGMDPCRHAGVFRLHSCAKGMGRGVEPRCLFVESHFMQKGMRKIELIVPWTVPVKEVIGDGRLDRNVF